MILKFLAILIIFPFIVEIFLSFIIKRTRKNRVRKTIAFPFYFLAIYYGLSLLFGTWIIALIVIVFFSIFVVLQTKKYVKKRYRSIAMAYMIKYFPMYFTEYGRILYGVTFLALIIKQFIAMP